MPRARIHPRVEQHIGGIVQSRPNDRSRSSLIAFMLIRLLAVNPLPVADIRDVDDDVAHLRWRMLTG
jgi:hypothetical protein